ncbi:DUF1217 domain-containing protein [Ferrovibrio sp.]|uniref:DUF1217 domain-containing protein n=1 Tax=Ferrovibrio sp. TaxID=1917215 RepID=UPI003511DB9A
MAIDLSVLLGGGVSTATVSPLAMYKKLQKLAAENEAKNQPDAAAAKAKEVARELNNAAVRVRNSQYRESNARVENDALYYQNRVKTATTVNELISDDRFLKVLATANGLSDLYNTDRQRLRDILTSDLSDPGSVAYQGPLKHLELAKKYNFGAAGTQLDVNGNTVGLDADGKLANDGTVVTALPAGLARIKGIALDFNGDAVVVDDITSTNYGKLVGNLGTAAADAKAYSGALTKALLEEQAAPSDTANYYEYDGEEYQKFIGRSDIKKQVDYYRENIGSVQSLDDLFKDSRLLTFLLKSYGLESEAQYPGKIRKIIESDITDINSLANRFQDPRFLKLTEDLNVKVFGVIKLKLGLQTDKVVDNYQRTSYEENLDEQAPGVRAAIEFERRIKDVSQTVQLLGDNVLREVVTVANNIPQELAYQEVDSQVTALEKRVDVNELKNDAGAVEKLVLRYLTFKDSGLSSSGGQSYLLDLFG